MTWSLDIENVAGIRSGEATLKPGINAVRASNWQGKSSFISAIKTAMGTDRPLTEGQQVGRVTLETDDRAITVELSRNDSTVVSEGDSYLSDEYARRCAELFAFLDESNAVRNAVRNEEDLESILTEPLDLANIDEQIADLKRERERVEAELERADEASDRVPKLEREINEAEETLEDLRAERDELRSSTADRGDIESLREELSDVRSEKSQVTDLIDRTERTVERIREKLNDRYEELESIEVPKNGDLEAEIADASDGLDDLERDKELLRSLYSVNSRILSEGRLELLSDVEHGLITDSHTCWVCGSDASREDIESRLAAIRDEIDRIENEVEERRERVEQLQERRDEQRRARRRERDLQEEVQHLEDTLNDREGSLESARERRDILSDRLEELEQQVDASDDKLTDIESEIKYTETRIEELREELDSCRRESDRRHALSEERDKVTEEIADLRNRKAYVREETRRAFDDAISDIVETFETSFESAHLTGNFDPVVARDGREVSLDALSEGERELLGITVALAGYQAYDVDELVPVMLLDSLGGLANENLNALVEYLQDRPKYLVMTAYPENRSLGDWEIDPNDWSIVSNRNAGVA